MIQLEVRPEFRDKIPPLSEDEYSRLEANILEDGEVREPIVAWGDTIIDGHNRYKIVQAHPEIPFRVKQMNFADEWDAIAWMCRNQLGRRNLTEQMRMKLIQEEHDAIAKSEGGQIGNSNAKKQLGEKSQVVFSDRNQTRRIIANEHGISTSSVRAAVEFGRGLDAAETASPGIKEAILSGEVKAPKSVIARIRNIPEEQRPAAVEAIKRGEPIPLDRPKKGRSSNPEGYSRQMREENEIISKVVEDMYNTNRVVVHTVDHLLEDLDCLIIDFIKKINTSLEIFGDTLGEDGAREKVCAAFKALENKIEEIRGRVQ